MNNVHNLTVEEQDITEQNRTEHYIST